VDLVLVKLEDNISSACWISLRLVGVEFHRSISLLKNRFDATCLSCCLCYNMHVSCGGSWRKLLTRPLSQTFHTLRLSWSPTTEMMRGVVEGGYLRIRSSDGAGFLPELVMKCGSQWKAIFSIGTRENAKSPSNEGFRSTVQKEIL